MFCKKFYKNDFLHHASYFKFLKCYNKIIFKIFTQITTYKYLFKININGLRQILCIINMHIKLAMPLKYLTKY